MDRLIESLDRLVAEGGPEAASPDTREAVVLAARRVADQARSDAAADPRPHIDPTDIVAEALLRYGDVVVDGVLRSDAPLAGVIAVKRSVRFALSTVDTHIRAMHRRRVAERGRMLGDFGRTLTHEIKNRLGAAETALLMLEQMADADEAMQDRIYTLVAKSLDGALTSVADVRGMSSFRTATGFPATRPSSVDEVVRRAVDGVRLDAEQRGVEIRVESLPDVRVDGGSARLVLANLVENAVKYSDPNRSDRWVRLRADVDGDTVVIEVADNGVGIPKEFHEAVFHRSVRVDDDRPGSGLGLAIVREAVRELGGDIELDSVPREGTQVRVRLPCRGPDG
ncbi:HAMP domain-containing sensor histidine kinase [Gaopeijia maritima]|uniref:sensor histidine kinase n=1 Tax=Gaopeijia maritima TaxID=3119007 RepID=UPI00324F804F